jgi:hypothetical protein
MVNIGFVFPAFLFIFFLYAVTSEENFSFVDWGLEFKI